MEDFWCEDGCGAKYETVVWRKVQVWRPSLSTSGGQSSGSRRASSWWVDSAAAASPPAVAPAPVEAAAADDGPSAAAAAFGGVAVSAPAARGFFLCMPANDRKAVQLCGRRASHQSPRSGLD